MGAEEAYGEAVYGEEKSTSYICSDMADPLFELLAPYFDNTTSPRAIPESKDPIVSRYLTRLSTLSVNDLMTTEPQSLAQASHSSLLLLQSLSARSNASIVSSSDHLSSLRESLPRLAAEASKLKDVLPGLDQRAVDFSMKYSRSAENEVLDRRKRALLMARNADRLSDILDLPTLLSSMIASSTVQGTSGTTSYASALDLHAHIKRLHLLYRDSPLVNSIYDQTEDALAGMTSSLIAGLRSQNIKLAAAMRAIGWLRRVAPDLNASARINGGNSEGALGALFLVCRLATLLSMLEALTPLRSLADQETVRRPRENGTEGAKSGNAWSGGQQTERYLKRYIEIFREQSFAIVSMFKSIFPAASDSGSVDALGPRFKTLGLRSVQSNELTTNIQDPFLPLPSALTTFPLHLVDMLAETLKHYLPNVRDKSFRESLLTQVLYCASSLGRLGGDFSMILATLNDGDGTGDGEDSDEEWAEVMKKHRDLTGKLELLASGGGTKTIPQKAP